MSTTTAPTATAEPTPAPPPRVRVAFPRRGRIQVWSQDVFADPNGVHCRRFIVNAFRINEVLRVDVDPKQGLGTLRFLPEIPAESVLQRLGKLLQGASTYNAPADTSHNHLCLKANGALEPVSVFRHGRTLSTWEILSDSTGRLRLRNPAVRRFRHMPPVLEEELGSTLGIDDFRINTITGSVTIEYRERRISRKQLLLILERTLHVSDKDRPAPPYDIEFALAHVFVGTAVVSTYLYPPLAPVSAAIMLGTNVKTMSDAWQQLMRGRVTTTTVYTVMIGYSLLANSYFAASLMGWWLKYWPRLTKSTVRAAQERLWSCYRKRPRFVWKEEGSVQVEVAVEDLRPGDRIIVSMGGVVPVDGEVVRGHASVEESLISSDTGIREIRTTDEVYAGSRVIWGEICVKLSRAHGATSSAHINRMLQHAASQMLLSEETGRTVAGNAALPNLVASAAGFAVGGVVMAHAIARPDYLSGVHMSSRLSLIQALRQGMRHGIVVQDGGAMERLLKADMVVLEKDTPLLEACPPEVSHVFLHAAPREDIVLRYAAAALFALPEAQAHAIENKCVALGLRVAPAQGFTLRAGTTFVSGQRTIRVGSAAFLQAEGVQVPAHAPGHGPDAGFGTEHVSAESFLVPDPVYVAVENVIAGVIHFRLSEQSLLLSVLPELRKHGIKDATIFTEDSQESARALANSLGANAFLGGVKSGDLANLLEMLRAQGRKVVYIGDGARNPEAAAQAWVSISCSGPDTLGRDAAHIILLQPTADRLSALWEIAANHRTRLRQAYPLFIIPNMLIIPGAFFFGFNSLIATLISTAGNLSVFTTSILPLKSADKLWRRHRRWPANLTEPENEADVDKAE